MNAAKNDPILNQ